MEDDRKTKKQLIDELNEIRLRVAELKGFEDEIKQIRVKHEKFTKAFLQNSIPVGITTLREGRFVDVSDAFLRLMGHKRNEVVGHTSTEIGSITGEQRASFFNELNKKGRIENLEMEVRTKGGALRYGLFNAVMMSVNNEKYLLTVMTDITERKQAEEALRESDGKLNAMLQSIPDHMSMMDEELNIIWANETATRMFGNDIIGRKCYEAYHGRTEPCEPYPCITLKAFRDGGVHEHNTDVVDKEGRTIYFQCTANVAVRDGENKPITVLEISRDITESKRAAEALRESEIKYRTIVENMNDAIFIHDFEGNILDVNENAYRMLGYMRNELVGAHLSKIDQGWHNPQSQELERLILEGDSVFERENVRKDGSVVPVDVSVKVISREGKGIIQGFVRDISCRKQAEQALRETQLRAIVESTGNGILAVDHTGQVILSNRKFADLWNIPTGLLERNNGEDLLMYVSNQLVDPDTFLKKVQLLYQSTTSDYDMILFKDRRMMERYSYPLLNEGVIMGRVWSFRDITYQQRRETALTDSELLFKNVFSMSPALMGIHRLGDGSLLEINQMMIDCTGYQREELIGHKIDELGFLESSTLQQLRKVFSEQNMINNEEIRYKTKTGELRYGLYSAVLTGDNEEKKVLGLLFDITNRKQSETLLRLREEESQRLAKNIEETNIALRVVLSRRDEDQRILEEKIQLNVNEIILPFISSLKSADLEKRDKHYLDLLESNLKSILSPFIRNMSNTYKGLTPKETQIAEMIRQGKNSKDIADMLGASVATINTHRNNIRKKLNMKNQKINLRSHLLAHS
jgi:PAS domain S-box-containing protein